MFVNMCNGTIGYDMCTLYSCFWLKQPKIRKKRRSVGKLHSDVDLIKTLSFRYDLDELKLRNAIGCDVCDSCFNNLRSIFVSLNSVTSWKQSYRQGFHLVTDFYVTRKCNCAHSRKRSSLIGHIIQRALEEFLTQGEFKPLTVATADRGCWIIQVRYGYAFFNNHLREIIILFLQS